MNKHKDRGKKKACTKPPSELPRPQKPTPKPPPKKELKSQTKE